MLEEILGSLCKLTIVADIYQQLCENEIQVI